jgi:uncharacterized protein
MALIIDGHNLIGAMPDIDLADPQDEARLLERLRLYRAHADGQPMVVFFDSGDLPAVTSVWNAAGPGLQVRFSAAGQTADDAILEFLAGRAQPGQYAVVTNDHELAHRARMAGASTLSASSFATRLARRRPAPSPSLPAEPNPHDPAYADLYDRFVSAEKLATRRTTAAKDAPTEDPAIWIERLYADDIEQVEDAAAWLGQHGGPDALAALRDALTHSDVRVRAAALLALGDLGDRKALPDLSDHLQHDSASMAREAAAQSLGRIGDRSVEGVLAAAGKEDSKNKVRKAALAALAQIHARHQS